MTRFAKGTMIPLHTHKRDIKVAVISGTLVYNSGGGEWKLGPGSFLMEPAGLKHTTGASADSDLLFFEESDGPFDLTPAK